MVLPTQEHGVSLHLFLLSLISFISVLYFSEYSSFVSLGKFIPRYLILFVVMMNGIDSLISLSDFSVLAYRNASGFWEKAMAPHSSTPAWKIPWTEEAGRLQSMGSLKVGHDSMTFTFHFHALEKEMATYSSVLAWRIPGTREPGGLPSMESHRDGHN